MYYVLHDFRELTFVLYLDHFCLQSQGMRLLGVASGRQLSKLSVMTEASSEDGEGLDNGNA